MLSLLFLAIGEATGGAILRESAIPSPRGAYSESAVTAAALGRRTREPQSWRFSHGAPIGKASAHLETVGRVIPTPGSAWLRRFHPCNRVIGTDRENSVISALP